MVFSFVDRNLFAVQLNVQVMESLDNDLGAFLLSFSFRCFLIFLAALFAGGLIAVKIVGAGHRIIRWLEHWEDGKSPAELKVRTGDKFWYLAKLLNTWYRKYNRA